MHIIKLSPFNITIFEYIKSTLKILTLFDSSILLLSKLRSSTQTLFIDLNYRPERINYSQNVQTALSFSLHLTSPLSYSTTWMMNKLYIVINLQVDSSFIIDRTPCSFSIFVFLDFKNSTGRERSSLLLHTRYTMLLVLDRFDRSRERSGMKNGGNPFRAGSLARLTDRSDSCDRDEWVSIYGGIRF